MQRAWALSSVLISNSAPAPSWLCCWRAVLIFSKPQAPNLLVKESNSLSCSLGGSNNTLQIPTRLLHTWQVLHNVVWSLSLPPTSVMKLFSQVGFTKPLTAHMACKRASHRVLQTLFSNASHLRKNEWLATGQKFIELPRTNVILLFQWIS